MSRNDDRPTVALVTPQDTGGGIENYGNKLADAFEATDVDLTVVPIRNPDAANPWQFTSLLDELPRTADVVHVQFEAGLFGRFIVSGVCAPSFFRRLSDHPGRVVTTLHEVHRSRPGHGRGAELALRCRDRLVERAALHASAGTVVHSRRARETLLQRHGPDHRIEYYPHPVDRPVDPGTNGDDGFEVDAEYVLTTFGWVEEKKRYEDVVDCLPALSDAVYLVAGNPRYEEDRKVLDELFERAGTLGVRDRVRHLGYVPEASLPALFDVTDIAVAPYRTVTGSGAVNVALAYHCPVVATDLPSFRELRGECECLVTYRDRETLLGALERLRSESERSALRERAASYAERVTWNWFADEMVDLYRSVSGGTERAR